MPGFAAKQIASWLYEKKVASIDDMTNFVIETPGVAQAEL
mgnify:CR=1 FL=1